MGVKSYETSYDSYVDPIMNYMSGFWGFAFTLTPHKIYKIK